MSNTRSACMCNKNSPEFSLNIESRVRCNIILSLAEKNVEVSSYEKSLKHDSFSGNTEELMLNPHIIL